MPIMIANILSPFRKAKSQNHYICELMSDLQCRDACFLCHVCQIYIKPLEGLNHALRREPAFFFFCPDECFFLFICTESQSILFTMTHFGGRGMGRKSLSDHGRSEEERGVRDESGGL